MLKSCDVVLLTTNKKIVSEGKLIKESRLSTGCEGLGGYSVLRLTVSKEQITDEDDKSAELYIISDDSVKEGDWVIYEDQPCRVHSGRDLENPEVLMISFEDDYVKLEDQCKIIATTDESLFLPLISKPFILKYKTKYNKDSWFRYRSVMVEYDSKNELIINYDKTIVIKIEKKVFNTDEAMELAESYHNAIVGNLDVTSCPIKNEKKIIEQWKHENLYETV